MIKGRIDNRTYLEDIFGNRGSITECPDGIILRVIIANTKKVIWRKYKTKKSALKAWNNFSRANFD